MDKYEDEVICDLAEYYHLYDINSLPALYLATLIRGLRHDSRLACAISGHKYTHTEILLGRIIDELSFQSWTKTKDAQHNHNRPDSLVNIFINGIPEKEIIDFDSPEDFERARAEILEEVAKNGD